MIKTYSKKDYGLIKVFFEIEDDDVVAVELGNNVVSQSSGYQFYVDKNIALQIDKCELYMDGVTPKLRVRDGETIKDPQKTEKELEIERLEEELDRIKNAE